MMVRVKAAAGVKREVFCEVKTNSFEIEVRERAERNAANARIRALLAAHYKVPLKSVRLVSGHHAKNKLFDVLKS